MEYIEVHDEDVQPIKEPFTRSYLHVSSKTPLSPNTIREYIIKNMDKDNEMAVFMDSEGNRVKNITFSSFVTQAKNVAVSLHQMGIQPGDYVGVISPNSPDFLIAVGALILLGAIPSFLSYDLNSGKDLVTKAKDIGVKALILHVGQDEKKKQLLEEVFPKIFSGEIDDDVPTLKSIITIENDSIKGAKCFSSLTGGKNEADISKILQIGNGIGMDDTCMVFLTSGSTGKPKYVPWSNMQAVNMMLFWCSRSKQKPLARFFNDRPWGWLGGCACLMMAFIIETAIVTIDARNTVASAKPAIVLKILQDEKITETVLMPYILYDIINMGDDVNKFNLSSLRVVMSGGQIITPSMIENFKTKVSTPQFFQGYGMTEAACCMQFPFGDYEKQSKTVGYPLPHLEVCIRDVSTHQIVPPNQEGEICIRGYSVMKGYLNDPQKTKEALKSNGWYHTGDMGTLTPYGYITVSGRLSQSIKKGTVIVQPSVVENIISKHPDVNQVQVIGVPDARLYEEICALVIVKDGANLTKTDLKSWCDNTFGDNRADGLTLSPQYILMVASYPQTNTGKPDKRAMRKQAIDALNLDI